MKSFFEPRSVALIGVSRQSGPGAYNNLEMMQLYGYKGEIYVIHPKVPEICGLKTWPGVSDLPGVPEVAIISLGRDRVLPVFEECVKKGIRRVIIISQGFSDADERGRELQEKISAMARDGGVRVLGPNTMGVVNMFGRFSTAFIDLARDPNPPPLTMVVQSGVFQVGSESFTDSYGKSIDVGNSCNVDMVDVLRYLEDDPQTRIIVLHMEGMKRGKEFLEVAARVARTKPVIVLKTGRSTAGARAALSHTGSLVGEDAVFDAAFTKAGIIRVRNMVQLKAACRAFIHFRPMQGPRLGVVTATGACGIMTADSCEDYGLELAPFPESIRGDLENPHIAWHRLNNPVDIWPLGMVSGSFTEVFKRAARGLFKDDRVDGILGIAPTLASPLHRDLDMAAAVRELKPDNPDRKPLALWIYGDGIEEPARALEPESDVACFGSIDEAVMGLAATWQYEQYRRRMTAEGDRPQPAPAEGKRPVPIPPEKLVVGEAAFGLLSHYGIPLVPGSTAHNADQAISAAARMGYPVVLKIISPQWLHKSDMGGIRLDVASEEELRGSYRELEALFRDKTPQGELTGILVQKQIKGTELLFGIKRDPQFGPVIVTGMGGIYTEIFKDIARALAPVTVSEAEGMLRSLRTFPILQGSRGQKGVNLDSLVDVLVSLSRMALDYPEIAELDLNPVLANSEGCWCVDCRMVIE